MTATTAPRAHPALSVVSRAAIVELLTREGRALPVAELATRLGLHPNTVRAHLDLLVDAGLVQRRRARPAGRGRPPAVYDVTRVPADAGSPELTVPRGYQLLAEHLAARLHAIPAEHRAGLGFRGPDHVPQPRDGAQPIVAADPSRPLAGLPRARVVERLVGVLAEHGFAPAPSADGQTIELHRCPFADLAHRYPDVVCEVHLDLVREAVRELGVDTEPRLDPFVSPGRCRLWLTRKP